VTGPSFSRAINASMSRTARSTEQYSSAVSSATADKRREFARLALLRSDLIVRRLGEKE